MDTYTRDITRQHCKDHVAAHIILHPLIHVPKLYNCHKKTSSMYLYTEKLYIKPAGNKYCLTFFFLKKGEKRAEHKESRKMQFIFQRKKTVCLNT